MSKSKKSYGRHSSKSNNKKIIVIAIIIFVAIIAYAIREEISEVESVHYDDVVEQDVEVDVVEDGIGPVFSGLSNMTVVKNEEVDYKEGVTAIDENDGECEFIVDTSAVNLSTAGNYFATYTATDEAGNITVEKRKITVVADENDVDFLADSIIKTLDISDASTTDKVLAVVKWVRTNVTYSHKYENVTDVSEAAYYAFTQHAGDCFGAASAVQTLLDQMEITNQMVHCTDYSHYWNLVNVDGVWRHVDGTQNDGNYPMTLMDDTERYNSLQWLEKRDWDRSAYPVAD